MEETEFDKVASQYREMHAANIKITGEDPEYFAEYKVIDIASELGERVDAPRVLDFGAGIGYSVPHFRRHLPDSRITCIDVSRKSLELGAEAYGRDAEFTYYDGATIPFEPATFDVALASCVFHHIDHAEHIAQLREIRRVLKPGGMLCVFEHNPLNPLTRHAVNTCPFDENAVLIGAATMRRRALDAGFREALVKYRIFFPHFLRALRPLEPKLTWLPLGAQYYVLARP